jgi:hypothetical protein
MDIHILCPFYRVHLLPTLIHYFEPMGIQWHPIVGHDVKVSFDRDWIIPLRTNELKPGEGCYRKINDFIETQQIIDDDYYGFLDDDSMYEPGFFDIIRQQTAKILFYSVYRGNSIPKNDGAEPHSIHPIRITSLKDIRVCNIGLGMCIIKGEILKQTKFKNTHKWDDGRYMERLKLRFPNEIQILPDLWVFGNYFQVGRYTDATKFIKSNWRLPEYF